MMQRSYTIEPLTSRFCICKVEDYSKTDLGIPFTFIGKTDQENSLVCPTENVPDNVLDRKDGWKGFRISGKLDFSLIGILADITRILAENGISVFAVSTFDTDYIFIRENAFPKGLAALAASGYEITEGFSPDAGWE